MRLEAAVAAIVEPRSLRPRRYIVVIVGVPKTTDAIRDTPGELPNTLMPAAMSHLPRGGCTVVISPSLWQMDGDR